MSQEATPQGSADATPREAITRAGEALRDLESAQATDQKLGALTRLAVGIVVVLAWVGLLVHTFLEDRSPQVDPTSVALLAVALIAPFVSRLKALEVGGAKAEWQEGAAVSLKEIVRVVGMQQAAIARLFEEVAAREASATTGPPQALTDSEPADRVPEEVPRALRRLVWVDDHPEHNAYELESLRHLFEVVAVKSNQEALDLVEQQDVDALISDVGRDYDRRGDDPGGVQLVHALRQQFPDRQVPILYYTSARSIQRYGNLLESQGALVVTSLFSDLLRVLRTLEQKYLETTARSVASRHGRIRERKTMEDPDVVVEVHRGLVVGIQVASWLQRPPFDAFVNRSNALVHALEQGGITRAVLLTRPDVLDDRLRTWATEHQVEIVHPEQLADVLTG